MKCHYCDKTSDLRPYGPRGTMICFPCMKASPDREGEAISNYKAQLKASGRFACIDGTEVGPYPAKHATHQPTKEA